jgi:uncharacterized protein YfiM (DUF2279 family)
MNKEIKDEFFGKDKLKHFGFSFFLTNIIYQEAKYNFKIKEKNSTILSISIPFSIGIIKEIKDKKSYGLFSLKDIFWNSAGIISASILNIFY